MDIEFDIDPELLDRSGQGMSLEAAKIVARRVAIALMRGSEEIALDAIRDAWHEHLSNLELPIGEALLDEPLARALDDLRTLNALEDSLGIITIGDFLRETTGGLPRIPNIGSINTARLRNLAVGLRLRAGQVVEADEP